MNDQATWFPRSTDDILPKGNFPLKSGYLWHQHWIWERIVGARWLWYITVLGNWWWQWSWWLGGSSFRRSSWTGRWRRPCQESESEILKLGSNTDAALAFLPLDWWWWSCWCQRCFQFFYIEVELSPWGRWPLWQQRPRWQRGLEHTWEMSTLVRAGLTGEIYVWLGWKWKCLFWAFTWVRERDSLRQRRRPFPLGTRLVTMINFKWS